MLSGRTLRAADKEPWDSVPYKLCDVNPSGNRVLYKTIRDFRNNSYYLWERNLETGDSRKLVNWFVYEYSFYLADGSVLTVGRSKAERLIRLDAETGQILRSYELDHGWILDRPRLGSIFLDQSRRRFGVIIRDYSSFERHVTMIFDTEEGVLCKWQGGMALPYIGACFALRVTSFHDLEFWDLATGRPVHKDLSTHSVISFYYRPDGREFYVERSLFRGEEIEAFRLEYDYEL